MLNLPDPDLHPQFYESIPAKRLLAWLVDMVLIVTLSILVLPFTAFTGVFFFPALVLVIGFAYRTVTIANGSATWGMRFAGMELRGPDGARFDLGQAVLHTLGYTVSVSIPVLQIASIVMMLTTARKQGLTDHLMGSVAVNRRALA